MMAGHMRRLALYGLVVLSSLLLAACALNWIHSIFYSETLILVRGRNVYAIDNFNGELALWHGEFVPTKSYPDGLHHEHWGRQSSKQTLQFSQDNLSGSEVAFGGFAITTQRHFPSTGTQTFIPQYVARHVAVVLPSWFLTILFGALPAATVYRWARTRRRHGEGHCEVCGYDLRATADRCPECGTPLTRSPVRPVS
jgi:hypothetical protein